MLPNTLDHHRETVVGTGLVTLDRIHVGTSQPIFEELGGSCGNVLISLAMLGRSVAPILRLGADSVGLKIVRDLRLAGADTRLVILRKSVRSPVIFELLDPISTNHQFAFVCPHTSESFGRFQSITRREFDQAVPVVSNSSVFFADRLSDTICDAMAVAAEGGAIVFFEPSSAADPELLKRALATAHIFKYSLDRLSPEIATWLRPDAYSIVTAGHSGLMVRHRGQAHHCPAFVADIIKDTCGAGDMVTVGLIDKIIQSGAATGHSSLSIELVLDGIQSGQKLAAVNCAYVGARGVFRECGAERARLVLGGAHRMVRQHAR